MSNEYPKSPLYTMETDPASKTENPVAGAIESASSAVVTELLAGERRTLKSILAGIKEEAARYEAGRTHKNRKRVAGAVMV